MGRPVLENNQHETQTLCVEGGNADSREEMGREWETPLSFYGMKKHVLVSLSGN